MTETEIKPVHEMRLGNLKAVVWPALPGCKPNISFERWVKGQGGAQWERCRFFDREELLLRTKLCDEVESWFHREGRQVDAAADGEFQPKTYT